MSMQLQDVINAARDRHPAFYKTRVPSAVVGRFLGDYQNELIQKALQRDRQYLAQTAQIIFALSGAFAPGQVGAGVGDGLPGSSVNGGFSASASPAGSLVTADFDPAHGARLLSVERVVTTATPATLNATGAGWTTDALAGGIVIITEGTGYGQRRTVLSNTASQLLIAAISGPASIIGGGVFPRSMFPFSMFPSSMFPTGSYSGSTGFSGDIWDTVPGDTSLFEVVDPVYGGGQDMGVVTSLPSLVEQRGYMVKLDASGVPFIDWTTPLIASVEIGVPIPPNHGVLGGTVVYRDGSCEELTLCSVGQRHDPPRWPAAYTLGEVIRFCGRTADWTDVASVELRYVPIAPPFTGLTDYLLLSDAARPCLVARAASFMAMRVQGMPGVTIDTKSHAAEAAADEATYLSSLRLTRSARRLRFRMGEG